MNRADRKKQLITQGRVYRAEALQAKEAAREGLQPESLARNAMTQLAVMALSAVRNRNNASAGLLAWLPLVMNGASALSKKSSSLKPVVRSALIAGAIGGVVALLAKRKPAPSVDDGDPSG